MKTLTIEKIMLYCPKCNTTYEDDSQKFCLNDGGRLLPAPSSIKAAATSNGVFASVLRSSSENEKDSFSQTSPRVFVADPILNERNSFHTNLSSKVFGEERKSTTKESGIPMPVVRLIRPNEVPSGTADVGNRKSHPIGRKALTWKNPEILIGQTIKGRYSITDTLGRDDSSITYLAEDKIITNKEMIVRVLMEDEPDDFLSRIFAEERVSLSHINHPSIAGVLDSGELSEGNPFIVTEMVDGFSVREKLEILEKFEPARAARIIRQTSYALSELHQNGVLHRNLRPENIFLTITDAVTEQAKVTNFAISSKIDRRNLESIRYLSPEQLEGRLPNFAGDIYSLAVIAYEMLTGKYPFEFSSADNLLKAQKKGLTVKVGDAPFNLPPAVNEVLEKALSYEAFERYSKARDFGDALYNALNAQPESEKDGEKSDWIPMPASVPLPILADESFVLRETKLRKNRPLVKENDSPDDKEKVSPAQIGSGNPSWEKRSPDPLNQGKNSWLWMAGVGILIILGASWAIWHYALNRPQTTETALNTSSPAVSQNSEPVPAANTAQSVSPTPEEVESPPLPRNVVQPPDTEFFQNTSLQLKGDLARNYRGFAIYYPKGWQKNESSTNFIDISKNAESGTPIEQFLVSYYESRGTFKSDKDRFPKLAQDSSKKLAQIVSNYRLISEGEKTINNGWKSYEMKFEGAGVTAGGEKINLWGKRLFIPAARPGTKSGFVITMLATSLSPDVKNADDVGVKGELEKILATFEPSTLD